MTPEQYSACWSELKRHAPRSISWSHYDLAANTEITDIELWKQFLMTREVSDWLTEERTLLQEVELAKLTANVSSSRSVGQAQLISAMKKIDADNKTDAATGPAFVYCYIPLNTEQVHAPNVQVLTEDIFYVKPIDTKPAPPTPAPIDLKFT